MSFKVSCEAFAVFFEVTKWVGKITNNYFIFPFVIILLPQKIKKLHLKLLNFNQLCIIIGSPG